MYFTLIQARQYLDAFALERTQTQMYITPNLLNRWFTTSQTTARPSYATRLAENLKQEEVEIVKNLFHR